MDEPLLGSRVCRRCVPYCRQVTGKLEQASAINLWTGRRHGGQFLYSTLKSRHVLQRLVPTRLKLAGDVALGGIHKFVSTRGERCIARSFKVPLNGSDNFLS